jgi:hypothetical protein
MESTGPLRLFALVLLLASTHAQLSPGLIQDSECTLGAVFLPSASSLARTVANPV